MLKTLTPEEKKTPPVEHAFQIRNALAQGNFARFFKLYRRTPNKGGCLIEVFIDKIRLMSLQKLAFGFIATNVSLSYLSTLLAFDQNSRHGEYDLEKFLKDLGCKFKSDDAEKRLDCKSSLPVLKKAPYKVRRCKK